MQKPKRNLDLLSFRGLYATLFHEVFISPTSYSIDSSATWLCDSGRSLCIRL